MILDQVRDAEAARVRKGQESWRQLVAAVHRGEQVDATEIAGRLVELGKTADELEKGVSLCCSRSQWFNDCQEGADAAIESKHVEAMMVEVDGELTLAHEKHARQIGELNTRLHALGAKSARGNYAMQKLRQSADPELLEVLSELYSMRTAILGGMAVPLRNQKLLAADRDRLAAEIKRAEDELLMSPAALAALKTRKNEIGDRLQSIAAQLESEAAPAAELVAQIEQLEAKLLLA